MRILSFSFAFSASLLADLRDFSFPYPALHLLSSPALSAVKLSGMTLRKIGERVVDFIAATVIVKVARIATFLLAAHRESEGKENKCEITPRYPPPVPHDRYRFSRYANCKTAY